MKRYANSVIIFDANNIKLIRSIPLVDTHNVIQVLITEELFAPGIAVTSEMTSKMKIIFNRVQLACGVTSLNHRLETSQAWP